jgi:RNA polymerase sigma factor (sigma-70 family)
MSTLSPQRAAPTCLASATRRAAAGDERAWEDLFRRLDPVLRGVVRGYRLPACAADDVVATTWARAVERVEQLDDPGAIAGWLVVTARREALRSLQRGVREVVTADPLGDEAHEESAVEATLIARERRAALRSAVHRLPDRQRRLLLSVLAHPAPTYRHLSDCLDMPQGAIGPTQQRALERLRDDPRLMEAMTP